MNEKSKKIGVIGAGIIGTSVAYHLGKAGARVTVFDVGDPGNGVSSTSFSCLNAFGQPETHLKFRLDAIKYHGALAREIRSERHLHITGTLRLASSAKEAAKLNQSAKMLREYGSRVEAIAPAAASRLEPGINSHSASERVLVPEEGWVNARALCEALINASTKQFDVQYRREHVVGFDSRGSKVRVGHMMGTEVFDSLVLAAGNDTNALLTLAGIAPLRLSTEPGPLVELSGGVGPHSLRHVVYADKLHVRQGDHGGVLAGVAALEADASLVERMEAERLSLVNSGCQWVIHFAEMQRKWTVGFRPMPADGRPMIGALDEEHTIYVAVMHGGITLGPLAGRLLASEMIEKRNAVELRDYRPRRYIAQEADWRQQATRAGQLNVASKSSE
ncbi:NAD(P)/FAD-dependent oxidoreductase [Bradyrhizobium genosp. A]|uniref:NAD(P)/FAD-dependent oxidoreductase n=1 Tax=Bradyrhizobium genosp. A TaxID=83626 RepID=UPI003CEE20A4